jgi:predicted nucleic acid-binding protein
VTSVFADTSFYVAVLNPRDGAYPQACEWSRGFQGILVTTDFVLIELGNWLSRSGDRAVFIELVQRLQADARTAVVPATRPLLERGFRLYAERQDKDRSMTDCISFVVMREQGITEALTADHHFEQAGFTALL